MCIEDLTTPFKRASDGKKVYINEADVIAVVGGSNANQKSEVLPKNASCYLPDLYAEVTFNFVVTHRDKDGMKVNVIISHVNATFRFEIS